MNRTLVALLITSLLLAACTPAPAPEVTPETSAPANGTSQLAADFVPPVDAKAYQVDPAASLVEWRGQKVGTKHNGTVDIQSGILYQDETGLVSGQVVIDMTTLIDLDLSGPSKAMLENHLKSDDFFSVESHPTATLTITEATQTTPGVYLAKANLTIKGITNPIEFTVNAEETEEMVTATAEFEIDRSLWDVRFGSGSFFENLGDELIEDTIGFTVNLVALPQ